MMITRTQEKMQQGCSFKRVLQEIKNIFNHTIFQKSRLQGFLIIVIGVSSGGIMRYMATDMKYINPTFNDWIFEGMAQMSYIFAAAVAAIYINHGYGLEQPCKKLVEPPKNKVK